MDRPAIINALDISVLGKSLVSAFLKLNEKLWKAFPLWMTRLGPVRAYGNWLHAIACMRSNRQFYFGTFFFRNRPQLELARRHHSFDVARRYVQAGVTRPDCTELAILPAEPLVSQETV
jgi:hypothetical protein